MSSDVSASVDVAIVGGGPVGITLAHLLGRRGLTVAVFEREAAIYPLPRAIHFDGEVMRVFETAGLRAEVEAISRPGLKGMHFVNAEGRTMLIRGGTAALGPHGCASNHYFHQPDLEAVLRQGLERLPNVQLRTQHELQAVERLPGGGAALAVRDLQTDAPQRWQARWVVGCDGARSLVRRSMGSPMTDLGLKQPWLVFDVRLKTDVDTLPDHTVQLCDPQRPMTLCNVTGNRRRWEIMLMPGDDPAELVKPETLWPMISRWIRPDQADIERAVIYTFHSVIAQGWRQGPLLLAGDAAHQTPPFLGQGLCAGVRDAANLAWKIDAIARGRASEDLLDSYESERSPHVRAFIELAVRLGAIIQTTDPQAARERDARFAAGAPETFEFPAPRLGPGVWSGETAPVAQVFGQPMLGDGRRLDAVVGGRWALLTADASPETTLTTDLIGWMDWHHVAVLPASGPESVAWLQRHAATAVLIRPDRYIAALVRDLADLHALLPQLRGLQPPPAAH